MTAPYLGRIRYRWCHNCGVPVLRGDTCPRCHRKLEKIELSPPGEVKPVFKPEIDWIASIIDRDYGAGVGKKFFGEERIVLMNKAPGEDRVDEIIMRGRIYAVMRYDLKKDKFMVLFHPVSFGRIQNAISGHYVVADRGAIPSILSGKNLMRPGVLDFSDDIEKDDYVIVLDEEDNIIASGVAKADSDEISKGKGVAVKVKYRGFEREPPRQSASWRTFIEVNKQIIRDIESRSIAEIRKVIEKYRLPVVVSFSGGKDSLVALALTIEAGVPFEAVFLDTGIEFPQTVEYVERVSRYFNIKITTVKSKDRFWKGVEYFGPPGRDYRWCCKLVKTGPITKYYVKEYPNGALTIIGQRKYESSTRRHAGKLWRNPWTPKQISFSPIQEWSSLEIWAYIMYKGLPINELYVKGFYRIGCYLCPAGEVGDWEKIKEEYPEGFERWINVLRKYFTDEEIKKGAWRWREPPVFMKNILRKITRVEKRGLEIITRLGSDKGIRIKLNRDPRVVAYRTLHPLGHVTSKEDIIVVNSIVLGEDYIEGPKDAVKNAFELVKRGYECVGCGICLGYCPTGALSLERDEKIAINPELCIRCQRCLGVCPVIKF